MNSSLTVFVCSTYSDLIEEREAVLDAIRRLRLQHDSMEFFGARPDTPIETCLKEVRRSDVLVVIVGYRYGSLVPGTNNSFSEAEYNEGWRLGKPCFVYLRHDDVPVLPKHFETNPENLARLEAFKNTLRTRHTPVYFRSFSDLAVQVAADLSDTVKSLEQAEQAERNRAPLSLTAATEEIVRIVSEAIEIGASDRTVVSVVRRAVFMLLGAEGLRPLSVFLSYSHHDKEIVAAFADALRSERIQPWLDVEQIQWGDSLVDKIQSGIDSAESIALFMSRSTFGGKWQHAELNAMIRLRLSGRRSPLIMPILLEDVEVPPIFRDIPFIDLRQGDVAKGAQIFATAVREYLGSL
jgi:TIR domain/Domain of unknown function (DUF4062)